MANQAIEMGAMNEGMEVIEATERKSVKSMALVEIDKSESLDLVERTKGIIDFTPIDNVNSLRFNHNEKKFKIDLYNMRLNCGVFSDGVKSTHA